MRIADCLGTPGFRELYPFASRYFERNGLQIHYLDEGAGEPIVMLHGNPTWSFFYRDLVKALRGSYRCVVPDHLGMGLSDKPNDQQYRYTLQSRVNDLAALLDELGLTTGVTLVLHDWGGIIGSVLATKHPNRIKRIIVFNTACGLLPPAKRLPWQLQLTRTPLGALLVRGGNAFALGTARIGTIRPLPRAVRDAFVAPYDSWEHRIGTLRFVQDIPLHPGDRAYRLIAETAAQLYRLAKVPTLICWGERDFVFDHHFLQQWRDAFPHAEVHTFPDAAHYLLEDARDRIVPLVTEFLAQTR